MLIDMPLEQLKNYQGRNPHPADFDNYWNSALQSMKAIDPRIELVKSEFQVPFAECFDLWFTGVENARIHAKYLRPKNNPQKHPAIVFFHGYSGNAGDWADKLNYVALGYSYAALDYRGQGGLSEDVGGIKGNTHKGQIIRFDPQHKREDEIFTKLGYIDVQHLAPRIKGHLRMVTGMMDTICPPSSQFAAYNKITSKKEMIIYPDFGHENLPGFSDQTLQFMLGL